MKKSFVAKIGAQVLSLLLLLGVSNTASAYDYSRWLNAFFDRFAKKVERNENRQSIAEIVVKSGTKFDKNSRDYDILLAAVLAADLDSFLGDDSQDLTVFAPNDRAFIRLARDLGYEGYDEEGAFDAIVSTLTALGGGDPIPLLTTILTYHVVDEALFFGELRQLSSIDTLASTRIVPRFRQLIDSEPELRNPKIILRDANIKASNGVIHTISRVLIPIDLDNTPADAETITSIVARSGGTFDRNYHDYDALLNAVLAAGLEDELATLQNLTVFAPNDLAFVRLARALGYHGVDEAEAFNFIVVALTDLGGGDPIPLLTNVLLYHVSPEVRTLNHIVDGEDVATLLSDAAIEPSGRSLVDEDDGVRNPKLLFSASDLRASNGLIHTVNRVLLPVSVTEILAGEQ
ncbi:MAG: fasciclin domain-containing protein [Gammaproteobacteria bacterium]|nr:fasciclin domain-containing protein [Gammaproteobacteria bacterium]NND39637.1 fasciclin domain-containing protein [Pseudomonadales bacterium]NNM11877.1 fasciclin domain-containing protein [Pseudomonadales bacterium]RZV57772.1 MAG: fasciclin domain-containing protein [Pseudomonadales bacterium]